MANTDPEERTRFPEWGLSALLVAAVLGNRVLLGCLEGYFGTRRLESVLYPIDFLVSLALLFLLYRTYRTYSARGFGRATIYLLLGCLAAYFYMAQGDAGIKERFQIVLYFPLGTALYRARSTKGRNTGLRCYLDIFVVLMITVSFEQIVKGFSPFARYDSDPSLDIVMGMVGAFFGRNLDFDRPYCLRKNLRARKYTGAAPLLDLHLYWTDIVCIAILAALLLFQTVIVSYYSVDDLVGKWSLPGTRNSLFQLCQRGVVRCHTEEIGWIPIGRWGIEGNLLDGFFFMIQRKGGSEGAFCPFLNPWLEKKNRFRLRGDTLVFDNVTNDWGWPFQTLFRRDSQNQGTMQWKRIE